MLKIINSDFSSNYCLKMLIRRTPLLRSDELGQLSLRPSMVGYFSSTGDNARNVQ